MEDSADPSTGEPRESRKWTDPRYVEVVDFFVDQVTLAQRQRRPACVNCGGLGVIVMQHEGKPFRYPCAKCNL